MSACIEQPYNPPHPVVRRESLDQPGHEPATVRLWLGRGFELRRRREDQVYCLPGRRGQAQHGIQGCTVVNKMMQDLELNPLNFGYFFRSRSIMLTISYKHLFKRQRCVAFNQWRRTSVLIPPLRSIIRTSGV